LDAPVGHLVEARHLDWIVPMGYAAARAIDLSAPPSAVIERIESHAFGTNRSLWNRITAEQHGA